MRLLIVLFLLCLNGGAMAGSFDDILTKGELRCGYQLWPPYLDRDLKTGQFSGVYHDLMETIGKEASLKVIWLEEVGSGNALQGLSQGRYDMICSPYTVTPARARVALFSEPILYVPFYMYVRADDARFDKSRAKANDPKVTIATIDGDLSATVAMNNFPKAKMITIPDSQDGTMLLETVATGKADVTSTDFAIAQGYIKNNKGKIKRVDGAPLRAVSISFVLPRSAPDLKAFIDASLRSLQETGQTEAILKKHEPYPGTFMRVAVPSAKK